jgi:hypothetical protein
MARISKFSRYFTLATIFVDFFIKKQNKSFVKIVLKVNNTSKNKLAKSAKLE